MRLEYFTVDGYRSFVEPTRIELRPLTLLFGYNSAGKSALLRALPLLQASANASTSNPLALDGPVTRQGSFSTVLSRLKDTKTLSFELGWKSAGGQVAAIRVDIRNLPELRRQVVDRLEIWSTGVATSLELVWTAEDPLANGGPLSYRATLSSGESAILPIAFDGITPRVPEGPKPLPEVAGRIRAVQIGLQTLQSQIHWLSAVRHIPPRWTEFHGARARLEPDGIGVTEILIADALEGSLILRCVSKWYEKLTGYRLSLPKGAGRFETEVFSLAVSPAKNPAVQIPIIDTGEGMIQALPILVLAAMARLGRLGSSPILALEHPELHLQPAAHVRMAEIFCELARVEDGPSMLIETHSENLIRRVQLAIALHELEPSSVLLYWIRQQEDGRSAAEPIEFDALGRPIGDRWPPGVFSEASELASQLAMERRRRRKA
jgi:hypothetical protein